MSLVLFRDYFGACLREAVLVPHTAHTLFAGTPKYITFFYVRKSHKSTVLPHQKYWKAIRRERAVITPFPERTPLSPSLTQRHRQTNKGTSTQLTHEVPPTSCISVDPPLPYTRASTNVGPTLTSCKRREHVCSTERRTQTDQQTDTTPTKHQLNTRTQTRTIEAVNLAAPSVLDPPPSPGPLLPSSAPHRPANTLGLMIVEKVRSTQPTKRPN